MRLFSIAVFLSAVLTIFFEYANRQFVWIFKPLTMIFIIASVLLCGERKSSYARTVLAGLVFSLAGDVFLIPKDYFLYGLISFLVAHIFYTRAFYKAGYGKFNPLSSASFIFGLLIILTVYKDISPSMKIPVIIYATAISLMLCFALNFYLTKKSPQSLYALAGAFLFVVSDSILAINKFSHEFYLSKLLILSTYFAAQRLIARSTSE